MTVIDMYRVCLSTMMRTGQEPFTIAVSKA